MPLVAEARIPPRIGLLSLGTDPIKPNPVWVAFLDRLRELGYVEGQSVTIERRFGGGRQEQLDGLVADLARLRVDLVVATGDIECLATKQTMPGTPLVMVLVQDPVGSGLVGSLAFPGGNVTGLTTLAPELYAKRLQLLKEVVPSLSRVGLLVNPNSPGAASASSNIAASARALGIQIHTFPLRNPQELDDVLSAIRHERLHALVVVTDGVTYHERVRIADDAANSRLPTMYEVGSFVEVGGLIAYGPSYTDMARRAATYVDKILKGAKPADLPVERPIKFELVVNMKTAKALGITIPPSLLLRADRLIE